MASLVAVAGLSGPATANARSFYVALGDSLAAGEQPDAQGRDRPTLEGYANVVARHLGAGASLPVLVGLGTCGGATAQSVVHAKTCRRGARVDSQLGQAEHFLRLHRSDTALVTVDAGDNDVEGCVRQGDFDAACVRAGMASVAQNVTLIARGLRTAAGPRVVVVGLLDYDQFLASWLQGHAGQAFARRSIAVVARLNATLSAAYRAAGVTVADAGRRFDTANLRETVALPGYGRVPRAVGRICRWTWACSAAPIGFDDHANATGYRVIAQAILDVVRRQVLDGSGGAPTH